MSERGVDYIVSVLDNNGKYIVKLKKPIQHGFVSQQESSQQESSQQEQLKQKLKQEYEKYRKSWKGMLKTIVSNPLNRRKTYDAIVESKIKRHIQQYQNTQLWEQLVELASTIIKYIYYCEIITKVRNQRIPEQYTVRKYQCQTQLFRKQFKSYVEAYKTYLGERFHFSCDTNISNLIYIYTIKKLFQDVINRERNYFSEFTSTFLVLSGTWILDICAKNFFLMLLDEVIKQTDTRPQIDVSQRIKDKKSSVQRVEKRWRASRQKSNVQEYKRERIEID